MRHSPRRVRRWPLYCHSTSSNLVASIQETKVTIPANGDDVDKEDPVVQRDQLEVEDLHKRPDEIVSGQSRPVALLELLFDAATLHDGHAAEEDSDEGGCEEALVTCDASEDLGVLILQDHSLLQELEPSRCARSKDGASIQGHAACSCEIMVLHAFLLDKLLGSDVTGCKKYCCCDALGEEWP